MSRAQLPWPIRFRVTIHSRGGQARDYSVLTWLGPEKAIAIAVHVDERGYGAGEDSVYDVEIEELGPAPGHSTGVVDPGSELIDRMEF